MTIKGGNINQYTINTGTLNIEKGTVSTSQSKAIESSGTLTIGIKDGTVKNNEIKVSGGTYGVYSTGIFNFYDGKIEGKEGKSIYGTVSDCEINYNIKAYKNGESEDYVVSSGREVSVLEQSKVVLLKSNNEQYSSITNALEHSQDEDKITLLDNITMLETVPTIEIEESKDITLDLAGFTVSGSNSLMFTNKGKFTIEDSSRIEEQEGQAAVEGTGKLINVNNTVIKNESNAELNIESIEIKMNSNGTSDNYKKIIINEGSLETKNLKITTDNGYYVYGIYCTGNGSLSLENTSITARIGIQNEGTGNIVINNANIDSSSIAVNNQSSGTVTVESGTIKGFNYGIYNNTNGIIIFNNGTINIDKNYAEYGIYNKGNLTVNGGTITTDAESAIYNAGETVINGGTIQGNVRSGLLNYENAIAIQNNNIMTIKNGNISSAENNAIENSGTLNIEKAIITATCGNYKAINNSGTLNLGTKTEIIDEKISLNGGGYGVYNTGTFNLGIKNGTVEQEYISINGGSYGVYNAGTFNFYDGKIEGQEDKSTYGTINEIEPNYNLKIFKNGESEEFEVSSGRELVLLRNTKVALLESNSEEYSSIELAIANSNSTDKITIIDTVKQLNSNPTIQIPEGKNITIDLNGYTITSGNDCTFINNGQLTILDSNEESTGKIVNNTGNLILSNGNLDINKVTLKATASGKNAITINGTNELTLENGATINGYNGIILEDESLLQVDVANVNTDNIGIQNKGTGSLTLDNLTYKCSEGITNNSSGNITVNGGNIKATDNYKSAINNNGSGTVTINSGYIGADYAISNGSSGTLIINGGTIKGDGYYSYRGISNSGILTINGGQIDRIYTSGTLNMIDGTISTSSGTAINNDGTAVIEGGTITSSGNNGISNGGTLTIKEGANINGTSAVAVRNSGTAQIEGGIVKATTGIAIVASGGNITYLEGTVTSDSGIGVNVTGGTFTMGIDDLTISKTLPELTAGTYGVKIDSGTFKFYDGKVIGQSLAISGDNVQTPTSYGVVTSENNTIATLGIVATSDNVISVNGQYYKSLSMAIGAISVSTSKKGTIVLNGAVALSSGVEIPEGVEVTLELRGQTIIYDGEDYAITNNGTLRIIDYEDTSLDDESIISKISNTNESRKTIKNNGTLYIGIDDGIFKTTSPVIHGLVDGVSAIIYDGKIE